jgi:radical SAM-linked protein
VETVEVPAEGDTAGHGRRRNGTHRAFGAGPAPHDFRQGIPHRYRVSFAKRGPAALTGHLDFIRTLPRVLKRAGFTAFYSEGFHPKPVMEFAPPLPLGMAGLEEAVEIALLDAVPPGVLVARLQEHAPVGLSFLAAEERAAGSPRLSRELAGAELVAAVEASLLAEGWEDAPARFLERAAWVMPVERKRRLKEVDIRPAVDALAWAGSAALPDELVGRHGSHRHLWMRLHLQGEAHARAAEVAAAVIGAPPRVESVDVVRLRLLRRGPSGWEGLVGGKDPAPRAAVR